jgi:transcription antitermination factor NusG
MPELELSTNSRIPPSCAASWYALYTRHQHERTVALALRGRGIEAFVPLYASVRRWNDRNKRLELPLFPCYVFLQNPEKRWTPVLATPGVYSVVAFGGLPAEIPISEIEAIRRVVGSSLQTEPHPFLNCGDRVRLTAGPLEGVEGILVKKKSLWKLLVSVDMLQRSVAVEIDATMVERLPQPVRKVCQRDCGLHPALQRAV